MIISPRPFLRPSVALLIFFSFTAALSAATYFVSPTGNDGANGTSTSTPWRTIAKVNSATYSAGDTILFAGGSSFSGLIYFGPGQGGTAASPITLGSYDTTTNLPLSGTSTPAARATINGGNAGAFYAWKTAGIVIQHLNFIGNGPSTNTQDGVSFYNDVAGNIKYDTIGIHQVDVTGFGGNGIAIGGYNGASGFKNISVTYLHSYANGLSGMTLYGPTYNATTPTYANESVYVAWSRAHNNDGLASVSQPRPTVRLRPQNQPQLIAPSSPSAP